MTYYSVYLETEIPRAEQALISWMKLWKVNWWKQTAGLVSDEIKTCPGELPEESMVDLKGTLTIGPNYIVDMLYLNIGFI